METQIYSKLLLVEHFQVKKSKTIDERKPWSDYSTPTGNKVQKPITRFENQDKNVRCARAVIFRSQEIRMNLNKIKISH